jgi:cytochrome c-type biogenesis protein CcmH/NrfF
VSDWLGWLAASLLSDAVTTAVGWLLRVVVVGLGGGVAALLATRAHRRHLAERRRQAATEQAELEALARSGYLR